jgi:hypothetical protein
MEQGQGGREAGTQRQTTSWQNIRLKTMPKFQFWVAKTFVAATWYSKS